MQSLHNSTAYVPSILILIFILDTFIGSSLVYKLSTEGVKTVVLQFQSVIELTITIETGSANILRFPKFL
jgi:hypothetical protein